MVGLYPMVLARVTGNIEGTKNNALLITLLSIAMFAVGCDKQTSTSQQIDKIQTETKTDAQDMRDYTYAQKADFVKAMQVQLTSLNQDLDKLSATIDNSSDTIQAEAKPKLEALRGQAAKLNQQLADVQNATESTWDSVKTDSQKAYADMTNDVTEARQWMSKKIAP